MPENTLQTQVVKYLADVHGAEQNAIEMLKTASDSVEDATLASALRDHLTETETHERLTRERLVALGHEPSTLKDLAAKGGAMLTGAVAKSAPDSTGKFVIQAYAFEHLEIASYRMLRVVAEKAGDQETVDLAERILADETSAAAKLDELIEQAAIIGVPQHA